MKYQKTKALQIGITGGIGAGKSVICRAFETLGIPVYDADSRAKWLMENDPVLVENIRKAFGAESYDTDGKLNRVYLAQTVFHDTERLTALNGMVHPRVGLDYQNWLEAHNDSPYVLKEAALLFEAGSYKVLDYVMTIYASEEERIRRVILRDTHRDETQIKAIIGKQMTEEERQKKADFVIDNDGNKLVIPQVLKLHKLFLEKATQHNRS